MGRCSLTDKVTEEMAVELGLARVLHADARQTAVLLEGGLSAVGLGHSRHCRIVWSDQSVAPTTSGLSTRSIP